MNKIGRDVLRVVIDHRHPFCFTYDHQPPFLDERASLRLFAYSFFPFLFIEKKHVYCKHNVSRIMMWAIQQGTLQERREFMLKKKLVSNYSLLLMFIPAVVFFIVFRYLPIFGNIIAFKQYSLGLGIWDSPWVGWDHFQLLFSNPQMIRIIRNTLLISVLSIIFTFPFPILLAIMLSEVRKMWFKRPVQTLLYLPHFFSWVIVGGLVVTLFGSQTGTINELLDHLFGYKIPFLYETNSWLAIFFGSNIWKDAGFNAIIFLAAISSIDPHMYEAASIDGANKLRQIWHITLPSITPTIAIMLILAMGRVMEVGFDPVYNLQNAAVSDISSVISTYIYTVGIRQGMYSLTTAMGLFESIVGIIFVLGANSLLRRYNHALW